VRPPSFLPNQCWGASHDYQVPYRTGIPKIDSGALSGLQLDNEPHNGTPKILSCALLGLLVVKEPHTGTPKILSCALSDLHAVNKP
jgi:hypothetical protein